MQEEKKAETYEKIIECQRMLHEKNQERIRIGIRIVLIIPLIFLVIMFSLKSSKVVFLVLWIVSMFAISIYLIMVEYADYKIQEQLLEWGLSDETEIKNLIDDKLVVEKVIENSGILEEKPQYAQIPMYETGQTMKLDELQDENELQDEDESEDSAVISEEEFAEEVEQILYEEEMTQVSEKEEKNITIKAKPKKQQPEADVMVETEIEKEFVPQAQPVKKNAVRPEVVRENVQPVNTVRKSTSMLYCEDDYAEEVEEYYDDYDDYYDDNVYYDDDYDDYEENSSDVIYTEQEDTIDVAEEELVQSIRKYVHALSNQASGSNPMIQMKTPQDYAQMRRNKARERRDY